MNLLLFRSLVVDDVCVFVPFFVLFEARNNSTADWLMTLVSFWLYEEYSSINTYISSTSDTRSDQNSILFIKNEHTIGTLILRRALSEKGVVRVE